jgi:ferrous iron transport protein A
MNDMALDTQALAASLATDGVIVRLSDASVGDAGMIVEVRAESAAGDHGVDVQELERRLLEFGFVEGARISVIHEGAIGHDPIAVRLDDMRIALRRRDAEEVFVLLDPRAPEPSNP